MKCRVFGNTPEVVLIAGHCSRDRKKARLGVKIFAFWFCVFRNKKRSNECNVLGYNVRGNIVTVVRGYLNRESLDLHACLVQPCNPAWAHSLYHFGTAGHHKPIRVRVITELGPRSFKMIYFCSFGHRLPKKKPSNPALEEDYLVYPLRVCVKVNFFRPLLASSPKV